MMKKFFTLLALVAISISSMAQWLPQASGFTTPSRGIQYMHAVSDQIVWASAYDGSGGGITINEFTRTTNGGELWTPGEVLGGTAYGLGNICALDGNIAYVAVYKGAGNQDNTCGVYKTVNGGLTWTQLPGALQGSTSFANNVFFWNEQEGMCHGDVRDGYFEIYTTINGGTSWQRVPQTNITGGTPASGEGGWTSVIETTGENTIMFGTNKGKVYISDDRGFTWRVTSTGITPATNGGINEIAFTDPDNGIAIQTVVPVAYRRTSDGGATWESFIPTGPFLTSDLAAVPGTTDTYISTGAATGFTGISYSYDKGSTWAYFPDTQEFQFLATDWVDNSTGWCGAFNESNTVGGMFKFGGTLEEPLPPTNLQGTVTGGNDVHLTWDAPGGGGTGSTEELIYDNDGIYTGAYSYDGFTMAIHMSPQGPCQILTLKYLTTIDVGDNTFNAEVYGWDDVAGTPTTTQLYTVSATAIEEAWLEIDVTSANLMVSGDFVVGFGSFNETAFVGYDADLDNGRTWDFDPSTSSWSTYNEAYLIRAVVQYPDGSVREISAVPATDTPKFANITRSARNPFSGSSNMNPIPAQNRGTRELLGYNVWRNGVMIANQIGNTFYDDMDLANGGYSYLVTALYDNGESVPAGPVEIEITGGGNLTSIILDFEDQEDFDLTFGEWDAVDVDGGATYGFEEITFPHAGEPMAFIAFNPNTTTPPVTGMTTHGGERLGACFATVTASAPNNDWLISPQVTLGESPMLSMWVKSYTDAYGLEKYNVLVSTTDNNPNSFTQIAGPIDAPVAAWTYVEYDLGDYQGEAVYVAIQCISNDAFIFLVDDIAISFLTSSGDLPLSESLKVYPNPVNDVLNIQAGVEITNARLFNIAGQLVYESNGTSNEMRISTSEMPSGLYLLNITTKQGTITRKVSIR